MEQFKTFKWRYESRNPKVTFVVYARERKMAEEIIAVENTANIYTLKPTRFFFRSAVTVQQPPYELEQEQLKTVEKRLENRKRFFAEHPESLGWLEKPRGKE